MMYSAAKLVFIWEPRDVNLKHSMGIPSFTVCIDMNILETSLDEGHLYFY